MTKLHKQRIKKGLTVKQLAERAGVNKRTLEGYDAGYKIVDKACIETIIKLAIALECKIEDIIESEDTLFLIRIYKYGDRS